MSWQRVLNRALRDPQRVASDADWEDALRRWGRVCAWRGVIPHPCSKRLTRGHQRAHSRLGRSGTFNTQPECSWINEFKGTMSNHEFLATYAGLFGKTLFYARLFFAEVVRRNARY